jgi:lipid II:glycine glycyltransferase (peptidoglycan interpeptide bridge formation enzyme)
LQSSAGRLKAAFGWQSVRLVSERAGQRAGAQLLFRSLPVGWTVAYVPKGPVSQGSDSLSLATFNQAWDILGTEIDQICHRKRAIFLKVEPDLPDFAGDGRASEAPPGFQTSPHAIQPPRTILVDLSGTEDDLLGRMKQKTRYNLRLAQKKGIQVVPSAEISAFYQLMQVTGKRDTFAVHSQAYYQRAYELFSPTGQCELLLANFEGELWRYHGVFQGRRLVFLWSVSGPAQGINDPLSLQWEAMRWARTRGCKEYDLWGIPDAAEAELEAQFTTRADGLWGVYRFKRGFGGRVCRAAGPWDRVYQPLMYRGYIWMMNRRASGEEGMGG